MMQKKIKSLIYAGLGLVLCVLLCGGIGMTAQAESYGDLTYVENESGITITGYTGNKKKTTKLVIPEKIGGKKVTSISGTAFFEWSGLKSITLPKDVTSIGWSAFKGCSGLTSITLPKNVTSIESEAFNGCSGLTSITIPKSVTSIGRAAFSGCNGLTSIKVSKGNKYYDSRNNCNAIIETKSKTLVSGCKKTVIPKGVTSIGGSAFNGCSGLKSITLPKGVTSIEGYAFNGCSGLTSITIPDSVTSIEEGAFYGCSGLTSIAISDGVTSIGGYAFADCSSLTSITIPDSVTSIGFYDGYLWVNAFPGCSSLTSIKVSKGNKRYDSRDNCNAIIDTKYNGLISGCKKTVIPKGVTWIRDSAFSGCSGLKSITFPKGVTSIGDGAFNGCSGLKSITLPKGVTSIGDSAFANCSGLTNITLPDGVKSIGAGAFSDCSSLTSITIPKSVTIIGVYYQKEPFNDCKKLVISCYKDSAAYNYAKQNNIPVKLIVDPAKKGTILTVSSKKLEVMVTSSSKKNPTVTVTKITDKKAKKLTIPATVKVKGVTYKVTAISDRAFKGNKKLTTVTIGSNVTKIGIGAFYGCKNLKKITVTAGKLTTINRSVFKGIKKNATITVKGTKKAKTALKKQLKKKSIGYVKTWKIK